MDLALSREVNWQDQRNRTIPGLSYFVANNPLFVYTFTYKSRILFNFFDPAGVPVDLYLYMSFLIAWRIVCSRASPGEL